MMRLAAVVAVLLSVTLSAPARAAEPRVATTSNLVVFPGTERTVFHDGDPVRLCIGSRTQRTYDKPLTVSVDQRQAREGAHWNSAGLWRVDANRDVCWTTGVRVDGPHDADLLLRSRTLRGPGHERSVSPVRTLRLAG